MELGGVEVTEAVRLTLRPDDYLVVRCPMPLTEHEVVRLKSTAQDAFQHHRVVVVTEGMDVTVVAQDGQVALAS